MFYYFILKMKMKKVTSLEILSIKNTIILIIQNHIKPIRIKFIIYNQIYNIYVFYMKFVYKKIRD